MPPKLSVFWVVLAVGGLHGETGYDAWLRYSPLDEAVIRQYRGALPGAVTTLGSSAVLQSARQELARGIRGMAGRTLRITSGVPKENAIVLGTLAELKRAAPQWGLDAALKPDGYWLRTVSSDGHRYLIVTGPN